MQPAPIITMSYPPSDRFAERRDCDRGHAAQSLPQDLPLPFVMLKASPHSSIGTQSPPTKAPLLPWTLSFRALFAFIASEGGQGRNQTPKGQTRARNSRTHTHTHRHQHRNQTTRGHEPQGRKQAIKPATTNPPCARPRVLDNFKRVPTYLRTYVPTYRTAQITPSFVVPVRSAPP